MKELLPILPALPTLPELDDPRPVLDYLGLVNPPFLGRGIGSQVFDRGDGTVVKIHGSVDHAYLEKLQAFYARLEPYGLPFAVPNIQHIGRVRDPASDSTSGLTSGSTGSTHFTLERRLPGERLFSVLPRLRGQARRALLERYLAAVDSFKQIILPLDQPYGQVLAASPVQASTWRGFLEQMIHKGLQHAAQDLHADLGDANLRAIHDYFASELPPMDHMRDKALVHGDYWGDNVLVDQAGGRDSGGGSRGRKGEWHVSAVLDFAGMTLCGDPRVDVAAAVVFLEMRPGHPTEDADFLLQAAIARHGPEIERATRFYRLWYAAVYAFCKPFDPLTYGWCLQSFRLLA